MYREVVLIILLVGVGVVYTKVRLLKEVKAAKHGVAFLHCNTSGNDFTWRTSSKGMIRDILGKYTVFQNGTLKIEKMTWLDVGKYECHIHGPIRETALIKLIINTETIRSSVHSDVTLTCMAGIPTDKKIPDAVYSFYAIHSSGGKSLLSKDGKLTKIGEQFCQGRLRASKSTLKIKAIKKMDEGNFLCTAVIWTSEFHKGHSEYFFDVKVHSETTKGPTLHIKDDPKAKENKNTNSSGKMAKSIWYFMVLMFIVTCVV